MAPLFLIREMYIVYYEENKGRLSGQWIIGDWDSLNSNRSAYGVEHSLNNPVRVQWLGIKNSSILFLYFWNEPVRIIFKEVFIMSMDMNKDKETLLEEYSDKYENVVNVDS